MIRYLPAFAACVLVLVTSAPLGVSAQTTLSKGTGLPLPRFVSLRAGQVNMRTGPGVQYPVEWLYQRQNLPVEIIAEYRTWRKIRDWQGAQGWVHESMLSSRRTLIIIGEPRALRHDSDPKSPSLARAEPGVIGRLLSCPKGTGWCWVEIDGYKGWLRHVDFWGIHRGEVME